MVCVDSVLWELFSSNVPWSGHRVPQIISSVAFRHKFLPLDASIAMPEPIRLLLESIFQVDPVMRPTAADVLISLKKEHRGVSMSFSPQHALQRSSAQRSPSSASPFATLRSTNSAASQADRSNDSEQSLAVQQARSVSCSSQPGLSSHN